MDWIDVFIRKDYKWLIAESLNYCTENKGLVVHAYVIMSSHVHLIASAKEGFSISAIIRDFKKFTSKQIVKTIKEIGESRREWLLEKFAAEAGRINRAEKYKVWRDDNHAIVLGGVVIKTQQKIDYIHNNPVSEQIVEDAADYIFSSPRDYAGIKGYVKVELL